MVKLTNAVLIVLASAMLMSVAFIDGRPAVFTDTAFYYSQGEALAGLLGLDPRPDPASAHDPSSVIANDRLPAPTELDTYVGARSPFYGLLLFGATRAGSLWLLAALQSLAAALTLFIATRAMAPERPRMAYAASILLLTLASPLPFLTTFAMPEVFGGLAIASAIVLIAAPERPGWPSRAWLWLMAAYGSTCHGAYPPVLAAVLLAAAVMLWRMKTDAGTIARRLAGLGLGLALAVAAGWTWSAVHTAVTGHRQHAPPFLTARVLADGPGKAYLQASCRQRSDRYAICPFRDHDFSNVEGFLWAADPRVGVFTPSKVRTRLVIEAQERGFVADVLRAHPLAEPAAAALNAARQLVMVYVDDPLRNPAAFAYSLFFSRTRLSQIMPHGALCEARPLACGPPLSDIFGVIRVIDQTVALCAITFILWRFSRPGAIGRSERDLVLAAGLLITALVANAIVCGVVSGPFPRYGARLVWLIPWLAVMVAARPALFPARAADGVVMGPSTEAASGASR